MTKQQLMDVPAIFIKIENGFNQGLPSNFGDGRFKEYCVADPHDGNRKVRIIGPVESDNGGIRIISTTHKVLVINSTDYIIGNPPGWYEMTGGFDTNRVITKTNNGRGTEYYAFKISGFRHTDEIVEDEIVEEVIDAQMIQDNNDDAEAEVNDDAEANDTDVVEADGTDVAGAGPNDEATAGLDEQITTEIDEVDGTIQSLIREQINKGNKNIILTGAPGTGKTYAAKNFVDQYYEKLRVVHNNNEYKYNGTKVPYKFVQFHPSYDYTDFVQGIKPDKNGNFKLRDGVFKRFCDEVVKINKEHNTQNIKFFFIIDEINRADLSSVFGELMYSLEYRGKANKIELQYSYFADETEVTTGTEDAGNTTKDNMFYIPDNVVIIGTMNDIDRSVEAFDFALRRRFVWIEVSTDDTLDEIWDSRQHNDRYSKDDDEHPLKRLKKLNNEIENKESLGKQYQIGGAYIKDIEGDDNGYDYDSIWRYRIEPLIGEYMRGVKDKESILKEWEKKFKNTEEDVTPVNDGVNGDELDEDGQN